MVRAITGMADKNAGVDDLFIVAAVVFKARIGKIVLGKMFSLVEDNKVDGKPRLAELTVSTGSVTRMCNGIPKSLPIVRNWLFFLFVLILVLGNHTRWMIGGDSRFSFEIVVLTARCKQDPRGSGLLRVST